MPKADDSIETDNRHDADDAGAGEDDSSTEKNGDGSHLHDDQKSPALDS